MKCNISNVLEFYFDFWNFTVKVIEKSITAQIL